MANHQISSTFQGGVIIAEFINMKTLVYNIYIFCWEFFLRRFYSCHIIRPLEKQRMVLVRIFNRIPNPLLYLNIPISKQFLFLLLSLTSLLFEICPSVCWQAWGQIIIETIFQNKIWPVCRHFRRKQKIRCKILIIRIKHTAGANE